MQARFLKASNRGYEAQSPRDILFTEHRMIPMFGEITSELMQETIESMILLDTMDPGKDITLCISGPGGGIDYGNAIIDTSHMLRSKVRTLGIGIVASMDSMVLVSGEQNSRYALRHSRIMIHEPRISSGIEGSATSILRTSESIMETKRLMCEMLSKWTGRTFEEVEKAIAYDNFMTAEEAVEFGLCDKIIDDISELF